MSNRREYWAKRKAQETPKEREERLQRARKANAKYRAWIRENETEEEREERLEHHRQYYHRAKARRLQTQ